VHHVAGGQLAAADAGVTEQGGVAALDVHPTVGASGAAVVGQGVELLLALGQVQGQGLEALGALLKVQRVEALVADTAAVVNGLGEVRGFLVGTGQGLAIERTAQGLRAMLADPAAGDEGLQDGGHEVLREYIGIVLVGAGAGLPANCSGVQQLAGNPVATPFARF